MHRLSLSSARPMAWICRSQHFPSFAILSLLTSMGIPAFPLQALISLMVILRTIGVPAEGIGLIMAVDRLLDISAPPSMSWGIQPARPS